MNDIRTYIQSKFDEINGVDCGVPIPDLVVEDGKTYFGYELQEDFINSDCDSNYTMQISIIGRIVRKEDATENTLQIVDEALEKIKEKLKEMNFKYSYKDITLDEFRKIQVTGNVFYNELNKKLIQ